MNKVFNFAKNEQP